MKTVVITGASKGIGYATAKAFIDRSWEVICLSRTPCNLLGVWNIQCDITDSESIKAAFAQIPKCDVLFNNAGFGISGAVEFTTKEEVMKQFDLNFAAHVEVTKAALPLLKESKGKIIFTSSAASIFAIPFQSFYSATKASIEILVGALRNELKPFGVQVGCVRLGDIKTEFTANREKSFVGDDVYGGQIGRSVAVMEHDEQNGMDPSVVANAVVKLAGSRWIPAVKTVGLSYQALSTLAKVLPTSLVNWLVGIIYLK